MAFLQGVPLVFDDTMVITHTLFITFFLSERSAKKDWFKQCNYAKKKTCLGLEFLE